MSKRDIPAKLNEMQLAKRNETLEKIQSCIDEIKEFNGVVTKKKLIEMTGYSASTFSKEHVKELLKKNKVCQFKDVDKIVDPNKRSKKAIQQLEDLNMKLNKKVVKLESELLKKDERIYVLENQLEDLKRKYSLILGKNHTLSRKAELKGIDLE